MSKEIDEDLKALEIGAARILGLIPYTHMEPVNPCTHEDDGHIYGESTRAYILRCSKCGEYYEEKK
jgi:hypothetical protein